MAQLVAGYWRRELLKPTPLMIYVFLAAMLVPPLTGDLYIATIGADILFWIGLAASLNIIMGFAGYVSFGHVVFVGLGGYVMALLMEYWLPGLADASPLAAAGLGILLGALVSAALAATVGAVVLRLRGAFFAIATIGLDLTVMYLMWELVQTPEGGGEVYISKIPDLTVIYYLTWLVAAATLLSMVVVKKSRLGMGLEAIREDEDAAESLGVPTALYKTIAFTISAALAGAMGAVYAWRTLSVTPAESFNLIYSIKMIVIDVVGGLGTLLGPIVGGFIYYLVYLYLTTAPELTRMADMVLGVLAIIVVLFAPRGVVGYLRRLRVAGKPLHRLVE